MQVSIANFNENQGAVGMLNTTREKKTRVCAWGEKGRLVTTACPEGRSLSMLFYALS